jgi:hypothetical protein
MIQSNVLHRARTASMSLHPISAQVELICSERTYGLINEEIALSCLVLLFFISHSLSLFLR